MSREFVLEPFRPAVDLQIDYAAELNAQQHAAVTAVPGPSLVIAGAGSGKTRTLTYRVAFLLEQGIPPERILLLTFTNKAAREMMRRVTELIGRELPGLWGGTFHSIGARLLRRHAQAAGFNRDFTILDREDVTELMKACLAEAALDPAPKGFPKADVVAELWSMAVNTRVQVVDLLVGEYEDYARFGAQIAALGERYVARKRQANVMDFDDLLFLSWRLLHEDASLLDLYQRRFQFVLVDEYQDTNRLQSDLIDLIAARHHNVMAVGDDAQSIYSWRGAHFRNILEFPKRYPGTQVYKIETNYRSTPEILSVANAALAPNTNQFKKTLEAQRRSGLKPVLVVCHDGREQAAFVAQRAMQLREEGGNLGRVAVLYRSHFHALELQLELTRRGIPFVITSGIRFFEQAHIKDVAAYLRLVANPRDETAFLRLACLLPGVGEKSARKLWTAFSALRPRGGADATTPAGGDVGPDSRGAPGGALTLASAFARCASSAPAKAAAAWTELAVVLSQLETESARQSPSAMIKCVLEAGYADHLKASYTNHRSRLEDLEHLGEFAREFKGLEDFLTQLSLLTEVEGEAEERRGREDAEALRLSTVHQAKGLEFDVVFVIMLCERSFPAPRSVRTTEGEEEERRLFYVAITRARNELYLSYPLVRTGPGGGEGTQQASRFLGDLSPEVLETCHLRSYAPYG